MIVKIAFEKQIHLYRGQMQLRKVKNHCQSVFKVLPKHFEFYYFDNEGDRISVNSQQDLDIIFESQEQNSIKKIFIQECDNSFELLSVNSNPEQAQELTKQNFCKFTDYSKQIATVNIVKQQMSRKEEQTIKKVTNDFLIEMENKLINKLIEEEQKIVKQEVSKFMDDIIDKSSTKIAKQYTRNEQLSKITKKDIGIQNRSISPINRNEEYINKLVDEKISKMIPGLIKQVVKSVQARIAINGCFQCQRKSTQMQMEQMIRTSLLKKCQKKFNQC